MIRSPEHVKLIRVKAEVAAKSVAELEGQVKDPYFRRYLKFIRNTLGDIESIFLQPLALESRTPAQETKMLANADWALHIAEEMLKKIQDDVAKYGPDVTAI
jgi:hypothetical protein